MFLKSILHLPLLSLVATAAPIDNQSPNPVIIERQGNNCQVAPGYQGQPQPPLLQLIEFWLIHRNSPDPDPRGWIDIGREDPARNRHRHDVQI
ncbi:hypothetical protein IAQ61_006320 [Plenodomus lingam]|uniref:uncharacterized protein n=1 Tax=Leptosphaeria maculans TaxID=5022 RepID=UPI003327388C|nr:hypothetical protein IAQ61_006320 [Plenodomus lingam]